MSMPFSSVPLAYNLARVVLGAAAHRQRLPIGRLSFIDAVRWLRSAKQGSALCKLVVNPNRPDRVEPRVVKRRPKNYDRMTRPRAELMQSPPVLAYTTTLPSHLALPVEDRELGLVGRAAYHVGTIGEAFDDPEQILGRLLTRALWGRWGPLTFPGCQKGRVASRMPLPRGRKGGGPCG